MPIFIRTKTVCYCIWCTALVLLDVVGSGCGALRCRMRVHSANIILILVAVTSVRCVREAKENLFHDTSILDALEWSFHPLADVLCPSIT